MTLGMLKRTPGCRKGVPRCQKCSPLTRQMRPETPKRSVMALKTTAGCQKGIPERQKGTHDAAKGLMHRQAALDHPRRALDKIFGNHLYFLDTRLQHRNSDLEGRALASKVGDRISGLSNVSFRRRFSSGVIGMIE